MSYSMDYYGNNDYRDYLAHYGVKGMKWGKHLFSDLVNAAQSNATKYMSQYKSVAKKRNIVNNIPKTLMSKAQTFNNRRYDYERAARTAGKTANRAHNRAVAAGHNAREAQKQYKPDSFGRTDYETLNKVNQFRSDEGKYRSEANKAIGKKFASSVLSSFNRSKSTLYTNKGKGASSRSAGASYALNKSASEKKIKMDKAKDALNKVNTLESRLTSGGKAFERMHESLRPKKQPKQSVQSRIRSAITNLPNTIKSIPGKIISAGKAIVDRIVGFFTRRFKKKK